MILSSRFVYTLLLFGGRHPLWGVGVISTISETLIPTPEIALTADSLPLPGPFKYTLTVLNPKSYATLAQSSAAT